MPRPVFGVSYGPLLLGAGVVVLVGGGIALAVTLQKHKEALPPAPSPPLGLPPPPQPSPAAPVTPARPSSSASGVPARPASPPASGGPSDLSPKDVRTIAGSVQIPPMQAPSAPAAPVAQAPARTLRQGMSGEDVRGLQLLLKALGQNVDTDGQFGPKTTAAVRVVQQQAGLNPADGIVGPRTRKAMQDAYAQAVANAGARPLVG